MKQKLELDDIQLSFGNRRILSNIYMRCEGNTIIGLLGRNGQGKSCLMQIIFGSLSAESKSIRFNNRSVPEAYKQPSLINYLPQFNFIPKGLTLRSVFRDFNLPFEAFESQFPEFNNRSAAKMKQLSGGERRLVELYLIVSAATSFSMLDEPFTHLNPIQIEKVKAFLLQEKSKKGIIITDHMFAHVLDICDTTYLLSDGKCHRIEAQQEIVDLGYVRHLP